MTFRATTPMGVIHRVASEAPELALVAAIVQQALTDAREGDPEARGWLGSADCLRWLAWLAPSDPVGVQQALIARLPAPRPYQTVFDIDDLDDFEETA